MPILSQVLALGGKIGSACGYCLIYVIFPELFPTVVRNMGVGFLFTAGQIGSTICPFILYAGKYSIFFSRLTFCFLTEQKEGDRETGLNIYFQLHSSISNQKLAMSLTISCQICYFLPSPTENVRVPYYPKFPLTVLLLLLYLYSVNKLPRK